ncbi:MAG: hypothetical protein JWP63_1884 [Candidatus Solibacter sp.]|nr:hypothetical protein [Candidatus Solibacter sp.]
MTWHAIETAEDVAYLMRVFRNFHDGCVREMHVATGHYVRTDLSMRLDWRTTVHMLVQRQFAAPSAIEMRFEEVVELRITPPAPDDAAVIFRAEMRVKGGVVRWEDDNKATRVAARKVYWRDASEWMRAALRHQREG